MRRVIVGVALALAVGVCSPAFAAPPRGAAPPAPQQGTCLNKTYTDPGGDAAIAVDALAFSLTYNCVYDGWRFDATMAQPIDPFAFGNLSLVLDTDNDATDGCDGFDDLIKLSFDTSGDIHSVTQMWRTPTCTPSSFVPTGSASGGGINDEVFLNFSQADLGDPGTLVWRASIFNLAGNSADFLPDSGSLIASGYPTLSDSYWLADNSGHVQEFGVVKTHGDLRGHTLAAPIVGIARVPDLGGYWLLGRDGGVFSYGTAAFYGSTGALRLNAPVVAMASTSSGHGYWFVASDGGIFSYGDAKFYGSTGAIHLNQPIVGMAPTPTGHGYWLVASDGGIFSYGDAKFQGSTGTAHLAHPIVAMRATHSGLGYRLVASGGEVYNYGDARHYGVGPESGRPLIGSVVGIG